MNSPQVRCLHELGALGRQRSFRAPNALKKIATLTKTQKLHYLAELLNQPICWLRGRLACDSVNAVNGPTPKPNQAWRKSRLAARLLIRKEAGRFSPRDEVLANWLSQDPEVTNRLIQQALYFLGVGSRKHAFDRKLVAGQH